MYTDRLPLSFSSVRFTPMALARTTGTLPPDPTLCCIVPRNGFEPLTSSFASWRSLRLSYRGKCSLIEDGLLGASHQSTCTGMILEVSLPKMSMTFTITLYVPGES